MADPLFKRGPHQAYSIVCGKCGESRTVHGQTMGYATAQDQLGKKFTTGGWLVGRKPDEHRCPTCVENARRVRARNTNVVPIKETIPMAAPASPPPAPARPVAEPPREMSRDERRLIFGKLNEVFLDETRGYEGGWSDKRVAEDLGVPRAWVAAVRTENFGDVNSNEEAALLVSDARAHAIKAGDLVASLRRDADALVARARVLADQIQAEINTLMKRAERIEKQF